MSIALTQLTGLNPSDKLPETTASMAQTGEDALRNTPAGHKLLKATQEFEAQLISSWWEEAEKGLDDGMGGSLGSGMDGLKGLAMNSVAMGMVKAGGIGMARMIFHSLEPALRRKLQEEGTSGQAPQGQDGKASQKSSNNGGG